MYVQRYKYTNMCEMYKNINKFNELRGKIYFCVKLCIEISTFVNKWSNFLSREIPILIVSPRLWDFTESFVLMLLLVSLFEANCQRAAFLTSHLATRCDGFLKDNHRFWLYQNTTRTRIVLEIRYSCVDTRLLLLQRCLRRCLHVTRVD